MNEDILMEVRGLKVVIPLKNGRQSIPVDHVDLTIPRGRTVGLVGESGCGKSMTARSLMRLLDDPIHIDEGTILYYPAQESDLRNLQEDARRQERKAAQGSGRRRGPKGAAAAEPGQGPDGSAATSSAAEPGQAPNGRAASSSAAGAGDPVPEDAVDIVKVSERTMRSVRGHNITMIFQEPMTALNPSITVGKQVREAILLHEKVSRREAKERVLQCFRDVGIPEPERRYDSYPHQLSGGLRQRICIAMAMVLNPEFLIADEPTTALDVTVEAQILGLMRQLQKDRDMSILLITHNLGVVADICDEVNVMYAGQIVEHAGKEELFRNARHPYTQGLMRAIPRVRGRMDEELYTIEGTVPDFAAMPQGCRFCARCPYAQPRCREEMPALSDIGGGHLVRCHRIEGEPV